MAPKSSRPVVPLEKETRVRISTREAAAHLSRAVSTLHQWNHFGTYPSCLKPVTAHGRLMWPVAGIRELLGMEVAE